MKKISQSLSVIWLALTLVISPVFAEYKLASSTVSVGSAIGTSASFRMTGIAQHLHLGLPSSAGFIIGEGFLRSSYFGWVILSPLVTAITPASANNFGKVDITDLAGANFLDGASVKLTKSGQTDISATQVVVVSAVKITCTFDLTGVANGLWDVTVTNKDGRSGALPAAFKVNFSPPQVTSIKPAAAYNTGVVTISDLAGNYFRSGAVVKLVKTGETDITAGGVVVESAVKITCNFDLTGKNSGQWDVSVTNDDGQAGSLSQGFKVEQPLLEVKGPMLVETYENPTAPTIKGASIQYNLSQDSEITVNVYNIRGEKIWSQVVPPGEQGGQVGTNKIVWNGITAFQSIAGSGVYIIHVVGKENGQTKLLAKQKFGIVK